MKNIPFEKRLGQLFPWIVMTTFMLFMFNPLYFDFAFPHWDVNGGADSILQATFIKTIIESNWIFSNARLGAPFGSTFFDFSGSDGAMLLLIKFFTLFSSDPTLILNVFYASSFILVFACAYNVFLRFDFDPIWATTAAFIYTCLPYHFLRGTNHLYLSNYFIVPLLIWSALRIYPGDKNDLKGNMLMWRWYYIPILLVAGSAGVYYAFFGIVLIFITGLIGSLEKKSWIHLRNSAVAIAIIVSGVLINLGPSMVHNWIEGKNPEVASRSPIESEIYGLRAAQLMLPIWGHQNPGVAAFARKYHDSVKPITEAHSSALGLIASAGFILLLAILLLGKTITDDKRLEILAKLNFTLFSFAVVGGLGVIFAFVITPQLRGTNRASIYIAFISILALFLFLKSRSLFLPKIFKNFRGGKYIVALSLMLLALYDQLPAGTRVATGSSDIYLLKQLFPTIYAQRNAQNSKASNIQFKDFVSRIEKNISPSGMIYVMPYVPFPESPPLYEEGYNALMRPYYYSSHARWSYGSMKGRLGDAWLKTVETLSLKAKVEALQKSGFEGIYIERKAYKDHGVALELDLRSLIGGEIVESTDRNQVFYRLIPDEKTEITPSTFLSNGRGIYPLESDKDNRWFWSKNRGNLLLYNFTNNTIKVVFRAKISALDIRRLSFQYRKSTLHEISLVPGQLQVVEIALTLAPGTNVITLLADKSDIYTPGDPRGLSVMLMNPSLAFE